MKTANNLLITGDRGGTIHMWPLDGEKAGTRTLTIQTQHTNALMTMWLEDSYLFTGSLDGHVKVWDASGNQVYDQAVTNQSNQPSGVTAILVVPEPTSQGGES